MVAADLYIIAAGDGSRLRANVPKALIPITDEPCLTTTLQQIGRKFRNVFVVTNVLVRDQWQAYFQSLEQTYPELRTLVTELPIKSGLGDGHATLEGLLAAERLDAMSPCNDVVISWGDVFFPDARIIDELLSQPLRGSGLLPAVHERNPYVSLLVDDMMRCMAADFSKHGETHLTGYHDQSVFRFSFSRIKDSLSDLHRTLWKNGRYLTPGGELSLLYTFHHLYNCFSPAYVYSTRHPTLSFNTIEEVSAIQREISSNWNEQNKLERLRTELR